MSAMWEFLTRTRGRNKLHITDMITYLYMGLSVIILFGPVLWLVLSSFKTSAEVVKFPPRLLPYRQETLDVEGYEEPLPLYNVTMEDGSVVQLAQVRRIGLEAQMIDPSNPEEIIKVHIDDREPVERVVFSLDNYIEGIESFNFARYLGNSVVVTIAATILTLLVNSMAAFALAKYKSNIGWNNNLLGVIVPGAATPTGVILLRQYMITIPDELIDAARIDGASEWRIYSQVIIPLSRPALAVLAIFSVMWRWNDFLWPLVVLSRNEMFTLQVGLNSFQGELNVQWHLILAMTVLTLLPITIVFAFLQRNITTGIATTGMK